MTLMETLKITAENLELAYDTYFDAEPDTDEFCEAMDALDPLDWRVVVNSAGHVITAHAIITLGGPNIYLDTSRAVLVGAWGTETAEIGIREDVAQYYADLITECYRAL